MRTIFRTRGEQARLGFSTAPTPIGCIYTADFSGFVHRVSIATGAVTSLALGAVGPTEICRVAGKLYVTCQTDNTLKRIDIATFALEASLPLAPTPWGVCWDGRSHLYIPCTTSLTIKRVNLATFLIDLSIPTAAGGFPMCACWDGSAHIWVTDDILKRCIVVDIATGGTVVTAAVAGFLTDIVWPANNEVWALDYSGGIVRIFDKTTLALLASVNVGGAGANSYGLAWDGGDYVYIVNEGIASVVRVHRVTRAVSAPLAVGGAPRGVCWDGATHVTVSNRGVGTMSRIDTTLYVVDATIALPGAAVPYGTCWDGN